MITSTGRGERRTQSPKGRGTPLPDPVPPAVHGGEPRRRPTPRGAESEGEGKAPWAATAPEIAVLLSIYYTTGRNTETVAVSLWPGLFRRAWFKRRQLRDDPLPFYNDERDIEALPEWRQQYAQMRVLLHTPLGRRAEGDFDRIRWMRAALPLERAVRLLHEGRVYVVFANNTTEADMEWLPKHEMLHDLLELNGVDSSAHPERYAHLAHHKDPLWRPQP